MDMTEASWKTTARTIVLSVLIGAGAGTFASALTNSYLSDYAFQLQQWTEPLGLSQERPRAFPKTYEEALDRVSERAAPGVVQLYSASSRTDGFVPDEAVLTGAVLTSDGWIVVDPEGISEALLSLTAVVGSEAYEVLEVVPDPATGFAFAKIAADHLPVAAFGDGFDAVGAEQVFVLAGANEVVATSVASADWRPSAVLLSDEPSRRIVLQTQGNGLVQGSPVANLSGELIGFVDGVLPDGRASVLPTEAILPALQSLLREGSVLRPMLGVAALDLARAAGVDDAVSLGHDVGAVVVSSTAKELQKGDVILEVQGEVMIADRTLDEHVLTLVPGDSVLLEVDRAGERVAVTVTLNAQK